MSTITLHPIVAPLLNDASYGQHLKDQFDNINENFEILAQHDFVKGDKGLSLRLMGHPLTALKMPSGLSVYVLYPTYLGYRVLDTIFRKFLVNTPPVSGRNVPTSLLEAINIYIKPQVDYTEETLKDELNSEQPDDNLTLENMNQAFALYAGGQSIQNGQDYVYPLGMMTEDRMESMQFMVAESYDPALTAPVYNDECSLNGFVFKDERFNSDAVSNANNVDADYSKAIDMSCVVYVTTIPTTDIESVDTQLEILQETPSLYYDETRKVFCWLIGGQKSGMIAQGPAGTAGADSRYHIFGWGDVAVSSVPAPPTNTFLTYQPTYYVDTLNQTAGWIEVKADTISNFREGDASILIFKVTKQEWDPEHSQYITVTGFSGYFAKIIEVEDTGVVHVLTGPDCKIEWTFTASSFDNIMKNITKTGIPNSLHLPYEDGYRHAIWSTDPVGGIIRSALHISPADDDLNSSHRTSTSGETSELDLDYDRVSIGGVVTSAGTGGITIERQSNSQHNIKTEKETLDIEAADKVTIGQAGHKVAMTYSSPATIISSVNGGLTINPKSGSDMVISSVGAISTAIIPTLGGDINISASSASFKAGQLARRPNVNITAGSKVNIAGDRGVDVTVASSNDINLTPASGLTYVKGLVNASDMTGDSGQYEIKELTGDCSDFVVSPKNVHHNHLRVILADGWNGSEPIYHDNMPISDYGYIGFKGFPIGSLNFVEFKMYALHNEGGDETSTVNYMFADALGDHYSISIPFRRLDPTVGGTYWSVYPYTSLYVLFYVVNNDATIETTSGTETGYNTVMIVNAKAKYFAGTQFTPVTATNI